MESRGGLISEPGSQSDQRSCLEMREGERHMGPVLAREQALSCWAFHMLGEAGWPDVSSGWLTKCPSTACFQDVAFHCVRTRCLDRHAGTGGTSSCLLALKLPKTLLLHKLVCKLGPDRGDRQNARGMGVQEGALYTTA